MDEDIELQEEEDRVILVVLLLAMYHNSHFDKNTRARGTETPHEFVIRHQSDPVYCHTMFRMSSPLFYQLHELLVNSYGLQSTKNSTTIEALGMFLWMVGAPQPVRQAMTIFGRSLDTVHRNFSKVLEAVVKLAVDNIKPVDPQFSIIHPRLLQCRFYPHFNDCIGAIDDTHIEVIVPTDKVA